MPQNNLLGKPYIIFPKVSDKHASYLFYRYFPTTIISIHAISRVYFKKRFVKNYGTSEFEDNFF